MLENITKPESRFVHETVLGILKGQSFTTNQIAIHIQDSIRLKKTLERFRRHFQKMGFWRRLIESHIQSVISKINKSDYAILDLSDIQKKTDEKIKLLVENLSHPSFFFFITHQCIYHLHLYFN